MSSSSGVLTLSQCVDSCRLRYWSATRKTQEKPWLARESHRPTCSVWTTPRKCTLKLKLELHSRIHQSRITFLLGQPVSGGLKWRFYCCSNKDNNTTCLWTWSCAMNPQICVCVPGLSYLFRTDSSINTYLVKTSLFLGDQRPDLIWWNTIDGLRLGLRYALSLG